MVKTKKVETYGGDVPKELLNKDPIMKEKKETKVEEKEVGVKELKESLEVVKKANVGEVADNVVKELEKAKDKETEKAKEEKKESKPVAAKVKKGKKEEPKVELEREYIVPLRKGFMNVPHYRRAKKAVKTLKEFMVRHMNVRDGDTRKVKVNIHLNNEIWFRGIKKPLHKIKVKAVKRDGIVYVELAEVPEVVKFKIAREAKAAEAAMASQEKPKAVAKEKVDDDKDKDGVSDKKEEAEDKKAGTERKEKAAKVETKAVKHTAQGKHAQKTAPVRKVLK